MTRSSDATRTALVVDDEALIADLFVMMLEEMGLEVCGTAATASDAVALAEQHRPDLVLMDVRLKGEGDGVDAGTAIHHSVGCPVLYITGSREPETVERIEKDHPSGLLFKPVLREHFQTTVRQALG